MSEKALGIRVDAIPSYFYGLDWIKILDDAIKERPTSWNEHPVTEWRNASGTICNQILARIRRDLQIKPEAMWAEKDKEPHFKPKDYFMPVVSLEWLEKYCHGACFFVNRASTCVRFSEENTGVPVVAIDDLLSAIKKQGWW